MMRRVDTTHVVSRDLRSLLSSAGRVRAACVLCEVEGRWLIIHATLTVLHDGMPGPRPLQRTSRGVCALDVALGREDLAEMLSALEPGRVRLPSACRGADLPGTAHSAGARFLERQYARRDYALDWPTDVLEIVGGGYQCNELGERFEAFIASLRAGEPPLDGRRGLCRALGIVGTVGVDRGGHLYVLKPLPVRLHSAAGDTEKRELEITVEAHEALRSPMSVSLIPRGPGAALTVPGSRFVRSQETPSLYSARVALDPGPIDVFLVGRAEEVADQLSAGLPSPAVLVHEYFDPDARVLESLLFGPSRRGQRDPGEFEHGVTWLLHLWGCAAMHLGRKDLQDAPDIVARMPSGDVLIGECSVRPPDDDKISKLVARARSVQGLTARAGVRGGVRAVLFIAEICDLQINNVELCDLRRLQDMVERLRSGRSEALFE